MTQESMYKKNLTDSQRRCQHFTLYFITVFSWGFKQKIHGTEGFVVFFLLKTRK